MNNTPIRVAMIMGKMGGGGVEAVVMNYYRHIDKSKVQFDFIIDEDSTVVPENEINKLGGRVFRINGYQSPIKYSSDLKKIFESENYKIVHSHINALSVFPLRVAKKCGIPIRIAHNHSTAAPGETKKNVLKYILRLFAKKYPTHYMSPTKYAGEWLFGEKIANEQLMILKNAVEIEKFAFNPDVRNQLRGKLKYKKEDFVIGNIGRLVWQKNQEFVLKVFFEYKKINSHAKLLIIGDGPLKEEILQEAKNLNIINSLTMLHNCENIADYYQVMDLFLFPSNYEGLGMVAVEAQISGLPVLASSVVPIDAKISNRFFFNYLNKSALSWANMINKLDNNDRSRNDSSEIKACLYDIRKNVSKLERFYIEMENSKCIR